MMPNQMLSRSAAVNPPVGSLGQSTMLPVKGSLQDLFTGGWTRRPDHLPSSLGRTMARWAAARTRIAGLKRHPRGTGADQVEEEARDREYLDALSEPTSAEAPGSRAADPIAEAGE